MVKLRVGYIIDDVHQSHIIWDLIEKSKDAKFYTIALLVVQKTFRSEQIGTFSKVFNYVKRRGLKKLAERLLFGIISRAEKPLVLRNPQYHSHFKSYDIDGLHIDRVYVTPIISRGGFVYRYSEDDLEKIKDAKLDVLIRGGGGILRGDILTICPYGIISFHHADNDLNRGGPAGFWEVLNREESTGFIIQRLSEELDGGDVLYKGSIATSPLYLLNLVRLYFKANYFMHIFLEKLGESGALPKAHDKRPYAYPLYTTPSLGRQLEYVIKTFFYMGTKVVRKLQGKSFRWGVAYQFTDDWKSAVLWRSKIIKNPPNRFLADPFVIFRDRVHVCFVEDYDYSTGKGKITAFKITADAYVELGTALEEDFHISYPFLFEDAGELFMCPETHESRDIRIYKCVKFPLGWRLHKILISDVSSADTNIFKSHNKWWLLTSIDSSGLGDHGSELHLFYADNYDAADWRSHPQNPIIFDPTRARNGGLLFRNGEIYRVFQVQGFDMYGQSMGIAKIKELTTESYREEVLCSIPPRFFRRLSGTHTYSYDRGLLALDFVKVEKFKK